MSSISNAIGLDRLSRISGYKISKGQFNRTSPNLPMNIVILGEANTNKQSGLSTAKVELTSSKEAITLFGGGSPIHQIMRILRPYGSDGVGAVPTFVLPLETPGTSTESSIDLDVTGTATANATHTVVVNGRRSVDFKSYDVSIESGDDEIAISAKIVAVINAVTSGVCSASTDGVSTVETTSKAKGTSSVYSLSIDTNGNDAGISYSTTATVAGTGDPDISDALELFGSDWHTIVINPYASKIGDLETFNGTPENATGRYAPTIFKPFIAMFGSSDSDKDNLIAITDASDRIEETTNALSVAPNSLSSNLEIAANYAYLFATIMDATPHLDISDNSLPDITTPESGDIGEMKNYNTRDVLVKDGCSTVDLESGAYVVQDFVTTYHPDGESPLQYSYGRNLVIDWNIKYGYDILEKLNVRDHVLVEDGQVVNVGIKSVSPKQWKAVLYDYFDDLAERGLIREPDFSKDSLLVQISETNPNRFETFFRYKRTGIARIESTDVEAGF